MNTKTINNIKKIFNERTSDLNESYKIEFGAMDNCNILMYIPLVKTNESVFNIFDTEKTKIPSLNKDEYKFSRYSKEYLKVILKTLIDNDTGNGSILVGVGDSMPLIIEDDENAFILAPRYDEDNENPISKLFTEVSL